MLQAQVVIQENWGNCLFLCLGSIHIQEHEDSLVVFGLFVPAEEREDLVLGFLHLLLGDGAPDNRQMTDSSHRGQHI